MMYRAAILAALALFSSPASAGWQWGWTEDAVLEAVSEARLATSDDLRPQGPSYGEVRVVGPIEIGNERVLGHFHFGKGKGLGAVSASIQDRLGRDAIVAELSQKHGDPARHFRTQQRACVHESWEWEIRGGRDLVGVDSIDCGVDIDPGTFTLRFHDLTADRF